MSFYKSWWPSLTAHVGVCIANYNLICETTCHCVIEFIEKTEKKEYIVYYNATFIDKNIYQIFLK